jgi:hypothetical protein
MFSVEHRREVQAFLAKLACMQLGKKIEEIAVCYFLQNGLNTICLVGIFRQGMQQEDSNDKSKLPETINLANTEALPMTEAFYPDLGNLFMAILLPLEDYSVSCTVHEARAMSVLVLPAPETQTDVE